MAISLALTDTFTTGVSVTNSYSFASKAIGTANSRRRVIVIVGCDNGNGSTDCSVASLTIGGIGATKLHSSDYISGGNRAHSSIWMADVPTGTTATIVVNLNGNAVGMGGGVYSMVGGKGTYYARAANNAGSNTTNASLSVPDGGYIIGACTHNGSNLSGTPVSWTNLTKDFDVQGVNVARRQSGASAYFASADTPTLTTTVSGGLYTSLALVSIEPEPELVMGQGSYTVSGQTAAGIVGHTIGAAQGSYAMNGQATGGMVTRKVTADAGSYAVTGQNAGTLAAMRMTADQGSYILSGQAAGLGRSYALASAQGSYTLTGQDIAASVGHTIGAAQGSYTVNGQTTGLRAVLSLPTDCGIYTVSLDAIGSMQDLVPSCVFDFDFTRKACYRGSGQSVFNLVAAPADGSAQSDYDCWLGSSSSGQSSDPTFTGTAGSPAAYAALDGGDVVTKKTANTTFLDALHKSTGGTAFWWGIAGRWADFTASVVLIGTHSSSAQPGARINVSSAERIQAYMGDGTNSFSTSSGGLPAIVPDRDYAILASYDGSGNFKFWVNTRKGTVLAFTAPVTTAAAQTVLRFFANAPAGSRGYAAVGGIGYLTDDEADKIISEWERRHERAYGEDTGYYTVSGQAAGVASSRNITAAQGSYALTGQDAALLLGWKMGAGQGSYALTGQAAANPITRMVGAAQGSYGVTGQAVNLLLAIKGAAAHGLYALTGQAVNLLRGIRATAAQGSYAVTGQNATLHGVLSLPSAAGTYAVTGQDIDIDAVLSLPSAGGIYTLAGQDAGTRAAFQVAASQGSYAVTGQDINIDAVLSLPSAGGIYAVNGQAAGTRADRKVSAATGAYVLTGKNIKMRALISLVMGHGTYAVNGQAINIDASLSLLAKRGSYILSGQAAGLASRRTMGAAQGSYTLTGQAVAFHRRVLMLAAAGIYALTGKAIRTSAGRPMTAAQGSYTLTGQGIRAGHGLIAAQGSYAITGQTIGFPRHSSIDAEAGAYILRGQAATLTRRDNDNPASYIEAQGVIDSGIALQPSTFTEIEACGILYSDVRITV